MSSANLHNFVKNGKKIVAATTNYTPMLKILNIPKPTKPTVFLKPTSSYIVEGQSIEIPSGFSVNQEIELGVVIGKVCRNIDECEVMDHIGGYCVALDMTATCEMKKAREKGLPWLIGKGFDTACPVSRFICKDEIPDPNCIQLCCTVNGKQRQSGNTKDFIFTIPKLVAYISQFITLEPNDVVLTGTPPGMGPVKPGDVIEGGVKDVAIIKFDVKCRS